MMSLRPYEAAALGGGSPVQFTILAHWPDASEPRS